MESTTKALVNKLRKCVELCGYDFEQAVAKCPDKTLSGTTFNLFVRAADDLSALLPQLVEVLRPLVRQGIGPRPKPIR